MPPEPLNLLSTPASSGSSCCAPGGEKISTPVLEVRGLTVTAGKRVILRNVGFRVLPQQVFGLIGPSGAGKSTLLRCLNRMNELTPGLKAAGEILLDGRSIYATDIDPDDLRSKVGMLFQQPVVFPTSIFKNVVFGLRHLKKLSRGEYATAAEAALREAALWDEVKDRLHEPAVRLSVGQQQRLCLARTLATQPEVILMDEPTSALDPRSTAAVEELITRLSTTHSIVLVTHNIQQARRVTHWLGCICPGGDGAGEMLEEACCDQMLDNPRCQGVVEYLKHAVP